MTSESGSMQQHPLARHDSRLLDLAFAMDTTGSMGSYIDTARTSIRHIVEQIVAKETSDVRLALVEYRDHPPQDHTYVTQVHDFTARVGEMKQWLDASRAEGGGDAPEAVADALHDVLKLSWRQEATKICVLVSDAPPHGLQASGDSFPNGCPAGHDPMAICRQLAEKGVTLYVAGCEPSLQPYKDFFAALAYITGGQYVPLSAARALTQVIIGGAQEELSLEQWMEQVNQQVLQQVQQRGADNVSVDELSREVMSHLNVSGVRSKRLVINSEQLAPASSFAKKMSTYSHMSAVRGEWDQTDMVKGSVPPPPPPEHSMARSYADSIMPRCAPMAMPSGSMCPPPPHAMRSSRCAPSPAYGSVAEAADDVYSTEEGEVDLGQAERMVQKALRRNNIDLTKE